MDRRKFLTQMTLESAFAWVTSKAALSAQQLPPAYANAVPVIAGPAGAGLSAADLSELFTVNANASPEDVANTYPQSVASGDPNPNGVLIWTRVNPAIPAGPGVNAIAWQIASDPAFSSVVIQGIGIPDPGRDNTVRLPIQDASLQPFQTYYYRFIYNQVASRIGRFKTLPAAGSPIPRLRLGYVVCQDYGNGYYPAYGFLAQEDVDYVVHLGDYIYESIASNFQGNPARIVPPFPSGSTTVPLNLDDYRHLYQVYRSDPQAQAVHEQFAMIQLWDDHEFANDCHQDFHPDNNSAPDTADTPQPVLRQAANQAWSEYGLADVPFDPTQDWEHSIQVYRKLSFGTLADLIVTDERLYRDGPPCGNSQILERYFSPGCPELRDPTRTMLGLPQRAWFLEQMTQSAATWKLWANEVMLMQLRFAGFLYVNLDQWDGYQQERNTILETIHSAGIQNMVALTGDLHTFLAGYLKRNFDNPFESPVGVELMVGSISSANLAEDIQSTVDLPSAPMPAKNFGVPPNLLEPLIRMNNPHIQYWDSSAHGYGILDITPSQLVCTFKAVTTIRQPVAELVTLRNFTIPAGRVQINQS